MSLCDWQYCTIGTSFVATGMHVQNHTIYNYHQERIMANKFRHGENEPHVLGHIPVYHIIHYPATMSPRKSSKTTSGWFWKVRSRLLVCSGLWVAILFQGQRVVPHSASLHTVYHFLFLI